MVANNDNINKNNKKNKFFNLFKYISVIFAILCVVAIIINYIAIYSTQFLFEKKINNMREYLGDKSIIVYHSGLDLNGLFFWDLNANLKYIRVNGVIAGQKIFGSLNDVCAKLSLFSRDIMIEKIGDITVDFSDDDARTSDGIMDAKKLLIFNKSSNKNIGYILLKKSLYNAFDDNFLDILSGLYINADSIHDKDKKIQIEDLYVQFQNFKFHDYTNLLTMPKMSSSQQRDDYVIEFDSIFSVSKFDMWSKSIKNKYINKKDNINSNTQGNASTIVNFLDGINLKFNISNKIERIDGKDVLKNKISNSFIKTNCCFIDINHDSLSEIKKGSGPFLQEKMIKRSNTNLKIDNYPIVIDFVDGFYNSLRDKMRSGNAQAFRSNNPNDEIKRNVYIESTVKKFKKGFREYIAKDDNFANIKVEQKTFDKIYINGYLAEDLMKMMDIKVNEMLKYVS